MKVIVGITGGSGAIYGITLIKALHELNIETHLVVSHMGEYVITHECGIAVDDIKDMANYYYDYMDFTAPIASGSFKVDGMVIVPCSMKTLSSVSHGFSESLLTRAADVSIKEGRKLVLVPRETPLSPIHLENMLRLSRLGVTILPASPGFYNHPANLNDIVYNIVGRILDQFNIDNNLYDIWQGV